MLNEEKEELNCASWKKNAKRTAARKCFCIHMKLSSERQKNEDYAIFKSKKVNYCFASVGSEDSMTSWFLKGFTLVLFSQTIESEFLRDTKN